MTALDTNVLIRYLVDDVPEQAEAARALIDELPTDDPGFICREVVLEVAWVLERSYRFTRPQIAEALLNLTASDTLVVEHSDDVAAAAYRFRQGGVGFSDLMILRAAERANSIPLQTFDRRLARMRGARTVGLTNAPPGGEGASDTIAPKGLDFLSTHDNRLTRILFRACRQPSRLRRLAGAPPRGADVVRQTSPAGVSHQRPRRRAV